VTIILGGDFLFHKTKTPKSNPCYQEGSPRRRALERVRQDVRQDDMQSKNDKSNCEDTPPLKNCTKDELTLPTEESLVIRCTLQIQVKEDDNDQQRENIFDTQCYVQNNVCSLIIDSGSYTNMASITLVSKLNLCIVKYTRPYRLQWLNDNGKVKMTKQVVVLFFIGKYVDEVLCDMVPIQASHILLGDHDNMIGRQFMIGLKIGIPL